MQIADMLAGTAACCKKPEMLIKIIDRRKKSNVNTVSRPR